MNVSPPSKPVILLLLAFAFASCENQRAQRIVDAAIEEHGGRAYKSFRLQFDFRNIHYTAARDGGIFRYLREFTDSTGRIQDLLTNDGFVRYRNGSPVTLPEERKAAFTRSVNSVIYFALLPFGLNDDAVNKQWIEESIIDSQPYDVIRVTFDATSGGDDHQDIFLYWFHKEKNTMDYLAYSYETEGGGLRFRKAVNRRKVGGITLQDYYNYKPRDKSVTLGDLQSLFSSDSLELLSEIRLENATVEKYNAND